MPTHRLRIEPAELAWTADGTPFSARYNDVYHAAAGAIGQANHVFLGGNGLPQRWAGKDCFTILETGFGPGLNFLATWAAWRADPAACQRLHFLSVEKHPFRHSDLALLHARYPELAPLSAELRQQWPELAAGVHRLEFEHGRVVLTLAFGDALALLPQFVATPDAIYLDGFSPASNPELWSPRLLTEIGLLAAPGTTLATWSVDRTMHENLARTGFVLARKRGFAHKRRMLVGVMPADPPSGIAADLLRPQEVPVGRPQKVPVGRPQEVPAGPAPELVTPPAGPPPQAPAAIPRPHPARRAIVVGAGLAGATIAERLCARGYTVDLFDRQPAAAMETSSNLSAVMLPMLSLDDNRTSRLNRACYLYALRTVAKWRAEGRQIDGDFCGVLQIPRDAAQRDKQAEILARCGFPESYVRLVDTAEATALAGVPTAGGGFWFAGGAWWNPPSLCRAALERAGTRLSAHWSTAIAAIAPGAAGWSVQDSGGRPLAEAPHLVLASAHDLLQLPQTAHLPLFRFRGQVAHLAAPAASPLKAVVCKEGYVAPAYEGYHCVGASFHRGGELALRDSDHLANLERLDSMLPGFIDTTLAGVRQAPMQGKVGFRPVSPDKLPIVGEMYHPDARPQGRDLSAVERWPGLYVATGYGARGLVWSLLMAELLSCQMAGEALPLEGDLAAIVDPARFLLRRKEP